MFCHTTPIFCFLSPFLFHFSNQTFPMCPLELTKCSQQNPKYLKPLLSSFPFTSWSPETHSPYCTAFPAILLSGSYSSLRPFVLLGLDMGSRLSPHNSTQTVLVEVTSGHHVGKSNVQVWLLLIFLTSKCYSAQDQSSDLSSISTHYFGDLTWWCCYMLPTYSSNRTLSWTPISNI